MSTILVPLSPLDQNILESFSFTIGYVVKSVDTPALQNAALRVVDKWRLLAGHLEWSKDLTSWCVRVPIGDGIDTSGRLKFTTSQSTDILPIPSSVPTSQTLVRPPVKYFRHSSTPCELQSYASSKAPILSIHVTRLSNCACVGITVPHGVFDAIGLGIIVRGINNELHGKSWVPPVINDVNIMRKTLDELSTEPPMFNNDTNKEPPSLTNFCRVVARSTIINKLFLAASIVYEVVWHKIETKAVFLGEEVVERLVKQAKEDVSKEEKGSGWVSTADVISAWFLKSAVSKEANPNIAFSVWVNIRQTLAKRDPNFNDYAHNGIVLCCTPPLSKELSSNLSDLAIIHRQTISPVRDIAYAQAYHTFTSSFKGGILPSPPRGEEIWPFSNQVIARFDEFDLGSEKYGLWHWNSPLTPNSTIIINKLNGGYVVQGNIRRERWAAIEDVVEGLRGSS